MNQISRTIYHIIIYMFMGFPWSIHDTIIYWAMPKRCNSRTRRKIGFPSYTWLFAHFLCIYIIWVDHTSLSATTISSSSQHFPIQNKKNRRVYVGHDPFPSHIPPCFPTECRACLPTQILAVSKSLSYEANSSAKSCTSERWKPTHRGGGSLRSSTKKGKIMGSLEIDIKDL